MTAGFIEAIALRNWGPFGGEHVIKLEAKAYAVTATTTGEPERSNYRGKSMGTMEAIRFALYGWHRHRLEDDWITNGELEGRVALHYAGAEIARERKRGKATKVSVHERGAELNGDQAEQRIVELVGLTHEDFRASVYIEQKQLHRFVTCDPATRLAIVSEWMRLEPLERLADKMRETLRGESDGANVYESKARHADERAMAIAQRHAPDIPPDDVRAVSDALDTAVAQAEKNEAAAKSELEAAELERDRIVQWQRDAKDAASYHALVKEGNTLKSSAEGDYAAQLVTARANLEEKASARNLAMRARDEKRDLARGEFDGVCPVGGMQCPIASDLNARKRENAAAAKKAQATFDLTDEELRKVRAIYDELHEKERKANDAATRLDGMRKRARELAKAAKRIERDGEPPIDADSAIVSFRVTLNESQAAFFAARNAQIEHVELRKEANRAREHAGKLRRGAEVYRNAGLLFDRARREIAQSQLHTIETRANGSLVRCGIDLSLRASWGREGKDLSTHCHACGEPFGKSQKVKACPRCAEPRGPQITQRLDLELSNRSGAADDLGGGAFQLAASAWLREQRTSTWGTALVDEPFGALDPAIRRAFGAHLVGMLRDAAFEQAIVISHSPDMVSMLPGRIEVVADGQGRSAIRVVS